MEFLRSRVLSFSHAFRGLWYVLRTQKNAWIHSLATLLVIAMAAWLQLTGRDWALLVIVIAMVWSAEFINTAIEAIVDLASPTHHPLAKVGKDVGAAAVLIAAAASIIVGLLVMGPPLLAKIETVLK